MRLLPAAVAVLLCLLLPSAAAAERTTHTYTVGPIDVAGYEVKQNGITVGIPKPATDGSIVAMKTDLVDKQGRQMPIRRLMLHHIVFANLGSRFGDKRDATCDTFTNLDSVSVLPAAAERFYGAGEERAELELPPGYGYPVAGEDVWTLTWMVMNHRRVADRAYIRYEVTVDDDPSLEPVTPAWLDVANCKADPIYDVPGGGAPGEIHERTSDWTVPFDARVVAGGGHVHGGAQDLQLTQPECDNRLLATSRPTWGRRDHPFYRVKPVLHEPGPVHMSAFSTATGFPVRAGQRLRLNSRYDAERPHTRVMGILIAFLARDEAGGEPCAELPGDVRESESPIAGRTTAPKVRVPLTGLNRRGRAVTIKRPPGKVRRTNRVRAGDVFFAPRNLRVRPGTTVRWDFDGRQLHDVTLASGPRGFSSPHRLKGRFEQQLDTPGTYRLFCSLHPVAMTQRIVVR
jgi:plastocyanin